MRWGLRASIVLLLTAIFTVVSLLISVVVLRINEHVLLKEAASGAQVSASAIAAALWERDRSEPWPELQRLQEGVDHLSRLPDVLELVVVGAELQILAHTGRFSPGQRLLDPELAPTLMEGVCRGELRQGKEHHRIFVSYQPLLQAGRPVGVLRATLSLGSVDQHLAFGQTLILLYIGMDVLLLILVGSFLLDRLIVRPLRGIAQATEKVTSGNLELIGTIDSGNEIGRLSVSFNRMIESVAQHRRSLQEKLEELSRANRELAVARRSIIRAERLASVGTLAAGVAHEVGNPLAAILGYTEVLLDMGEVVALPGSGGGREGETREGETREGETREGETREGGAEISPEEAREIIARIHEQTLRIHRTLRELLDYSRTGSPCLGTPPSSDLHQAAKRVMSLLEPQPRLRGLLIRMDMAEDLPRIAIEEERLEQVLVNLLLNAADAMSGQEGSICLEAEPDPKDPSFVDLRVIDRGPGIPPELLDRVFDPFFTTKEPGHGTGLGLAICERILSDARGEIRVLGGPGEGTTMHLRLPVAAG